MGKEIREYLLAVHHAAQKVLETDNVRNPTTTRQWCERINLLLSLTLHGRDDESDEVKEFSAQFSRELLVRIQPSMKQVLPHLPLEYLRARALNKTHIFRCLCAMQRNAKPVGTDERVKELMGHLQTVTLVLLQPKVAAVHKLEKPPQISARR
jgi:hypothetical protein